MWSFSRASRRRLAGVLAVDLLLLRRSLSPRGDHSEPGRDVFTGSVAALCCRSLGTAASVVHGYSVRLSKVYGFASMGVAPKIRDSDASHSETAMPPILLG
jgi:hypothetical protein